jgi:uncharacterized protein (DUF2252 family)
MKAKLKPAATAAFADGKSRRKRVPRSSLGEWNPGARREHPNAVLARAVAGRLPELLPLRRERMLPSAFAFFRGAAALMAYDLSLGSHTGIVCQICGDAHIQNLGAYAGEDGRLVFDMNDFDETTVAPFEWDLKRMIASILLAGRDAGLKQGAAHAAAARCLASYVALAHRLATMPVLDVARFRVRPPSSNPVAAVLHQAERATPLGSREALMDMAKRKTDPSFQFKRIAGKLEPLAPALEAKVIAAIEPYLATLAPERRHFVRQFRAITATFKIVGVGSVGLRDYCLYLEGNGPDDPLFLQIKQETASCYAPYLHHDEDGPMGQRVVNGQRAMQFQSDPLLGWTMVDGHDFLVRQLSDHKATLDATKLAADELCAYAELCGEVLAHGHARSGDARQIAGYVGTGKHFAASILKFAEAYAEQTVADWKAFRRQRTA